MRWGVCPVVLLGLLAGCAPPGDGDALRLQTTAVALMRELDASGYACLGRDGAVTTLGESRPGLARVSCLGSGAPVVSFYASRAALDADVARAIQDPGVGVLAVSPGEPLSVRAADRQALRRLATAWHRELRVVVG